MGAVCCPHRNQPAGGHGTNRRMLSIGSHHLVPPRNHTSVHFRRIEPSQASAAAGNSWCDGANAVTDEGHSERPSNNFSVRCGSRSQSRDSFCDCALGTGVLPTSTGPPKWRWLDMTLPRAPMSHRIGLQSDTRRAKKILRRLKVTRYVATALGPGAGRDDCATRGEAGFLSSTASPESAAMRSPTC